MGDGWELWEKWELWEVWEVWERWECAKSRIDGELKQTRSEPFVLGTRSYDLRLQETRQHL